MNKPSLAARALRFLRRGADAPRTHYAPDELHLVPSDLRAPDPAFLAELAAGYMPLAGHDVEVGRGNPFAVPLGNADTHAALHGFGWLNHLHGDPDRGPALAQRLVAQWLAASRAPAGPQDTPQIVARRVISWITHCGLLLEDAEPKLFADVMTSLVAQVRWLDGLKAGNLLMPRIAVLLADLTFVGRADNVGRSEQALAAALAAEILADGGHASRNPIVPLSLLLDLVPLRQCFASHHATPPAALSDAIARMGSYLRAMRLGDGSLARFNGNTLVTLDDLVTALSVIVDDGVADPLSASGYRRLAMGDSIVLMDCGAAPAAPFAQEAQAGCLSFEMSHGTTPILRNCGAVGTAIAADLALARATSSHNTLTVAERSSARLVATASATSARDVLTGPREVSILTYARSDTGHVVAVRHDGYEEQCGLLHTRRLELSADGTCLAGEDTLAPRDGILRLGKDIPFAIHFHVAADGVIEQETPNAARLHLPDGSAWLMTANSARVCVEIDAAAVLGARRLASRQIVLRGATHGETRIAWALQRQS